MVKFRPLHDRVLLRRLEPEQKTSGGLYIPETAKEKPQHAEVVAVGTGRVTDKGEVVPPVVKVGDRVLFARYGGDEVKLDGVDHLVLRESDILAIIES